MTTTPNVESAQPTLIPGSSKTPLFRSDFEAPLNQDISWEVSDGTESPFADSPPETPTQENTKVEEEVSKDEPQDKEEELEENTDEEDEEVEQKKKTKNRVPPAKRISDLTRRLRQAEIEAQAVRQEKEIIEKQLAVKQKEAADSYHTLIKNNCDRLQYDLNQAIEDGDSAEQSKLIGQLSEYRAELRNIQREAATVQTPPPREATKQEQEPTYQIPEDHPYKDTGDEWVKKNSWANPTSKDFSKKLYDEADNYSLSLIDHYKLQGKGEEIGSPEFFQEITEYIHDLYSLPDKTTPTKTKERTPMKASPSTVAPVNRQSANSETIKSRQEIVLSPEQKAIAHSMSGTVRDSTGKRITDPKQLEAAYIRNMRG